MTTILSQIVRGTGIYLLDGESFIGYATGQSTPDGKYFWIGQRVRLHFNTRFHVTKPLPQDVCVPVAAVAHLDPATWAGPGRVRLSLTAEQASRLPTRAAIESGGNGSPLPQMPRAVPGLAQQRAGGLFDTRDLTELGERSLRQMREATRHREQLRTDFGTLSPEEEALLDRQLAVTLEAIRNAYERDAAAFTGGN